MASPQYITPAELYNAYDRRMVEQLGTDSSGNAPLNSTNARVTTAIERASEDVQMAATVGGKYSTTDLDTLQTDDRWALKGVVASLAIGYLVARRMDETPNAVKDAIDEARKVLDQLRSGERVFPIDSARTSGRASLVHLSTGQRARMDLVSDQPFFPETRTKNF